jgi:hypothetical protein
MQFSEPAAGLEEFIRFYVQRDLRIPRGVIRHPVPARPAPMIVFEFGDPITVLKVDEGIRVPSPAGVPAVVGLPTFRRVEMELRGTICTLAVMFQPDGLQRLFSVPSQELPSNGGDALRICQRVKHLAEGMLDESFRTK